MVVQVLVSKTWYFLAIVIQVLAVMDQDLGVISSLQISSIADFMMLHHRLHDLAFLGREGRGSWQINKMR